MSQTTSPSSSSDYPILDNFDNYDNFDDNSSTDIRQFSLILIAICVFVLILFISLTVLYTKLRRKFGQKNSDNSSNDDVPMPDVVETDPADMLIFNSKGPLTVTGLLNITKHQLEDDKSLSLKSVKYAPEQNELYDIGTLIEKVIQQPYLSAK